MFLFQSKMMLFLKTYNQRAPMVKFIRGTDSVIIYSDVLWNTNVIVFEEYFLYNYIYALNRYFYPKCLTKEEKQTVTRGC